eukprot:9503539-Pyramimonas_sp.AAC.1
MTTHYVDADDNSKYRTGLRGDLPAERAVSPRALGRARLVEVGRGDAGEQGPAASTASVALEKRAAEDVDCAALVGALAVLGGGAADAVGI